MAEMGESVEVEEKQCGICGKTYIPRFSYQRPRNPGDSWVCSRTCFMKAAMVLKQETCDVCERKFEARFAFQKMDTASGPIMVCSTACRDKFHAARPDSDEGRIAKIAILNQKGGTGKTTTSVSLAAGIADAGHKTLLVDLDSQGHVGVSLGVYGTYDLSEVIVRGKSVADCITPARKNLDIITASSTLQDAEVHLARLNSGRETALANPFDHITKYSCIILDCGPALSLINRAALNFADYVIVPVSCDFLSLVGVKHLLTTLNSINKGLDHKVDILGVLPTFHDSRNKISVRTLKVLKTHFRKRMFTPIRVNTRLKEAPEVRKTIFDYAPRSRGANDYRKFVKEVLERLDPEWQKPLGTSEKTFDPLAPKAPKSTKTPPKPDKA